MQHELVKALAIVHERAFSLLSAEAGAIHRLLVAAGNVASATETVSAAIGWSAFKRRRHLLEYRSNLRAAEQNY